MQRRVILIVCTVVLRQQFIQRNLHRKETRIKPLIEMKFNAIKNRPAARNRFPDEIFSYNTTTFPRPSPTEQTTTGPTSTSTTAPSSNTSTTTTSSTTSTASSSPTTTAGPRCTETGPKIIWHGESDIARTYNNAGVWANETTDEYRFRHMFDDDLNTMWHSHFRFEDQVKVLGVEFHVSTSIQVWMFEWHFRTQFTFII